MGGDVNDGFDLLPARLEAKVGTLAGADAIPARSREGASMETTLGKNRWSSHTTD